MQKTFGMISLGCDKNRVDGERLLGEIRRHGCKITDDFAEAEVLIVNTCAFLNEARKEAIDTVLEGNRYRKEGKLERIVVAGCLPEKFADELYPALTEADVFLGIDDVSELFPALERSFAGERVNAVGTGLHGALLPRVLTTPAHYKYLKIAEGCSNHCTYCLIPRIRGPFRSYPQDALLSEAEELGPTEELILVAQDVTRYGEDRGENELVTLLRRLTSLETVHSVRLLYCYPERITQELIDELARNPKLVKYLDLPLQHSEDRILRLMGRKGTRADYLELLGKLRREVPGIALRSTFIAGFPSETEEEHRALCSFLEEANLQNCGFFAYSREPETAAFRMKEQVPVSVRKRRVRELYAVQREISRAFLQNFVGKTLRVVCDGIDYEKSCFFGRAYFQAPEADGLVYFTSSRAREGESCDVTVDRADIYDLYGHTEVNQA